MNPLEKFPRAFGLTDEDILKILALVMAHTQEKILSIDSVGQDAEITTGCLPDPEAGSGHDFLCVQKDGALEIKETGMWIA